MDTTRTCPGCRKPLPANAPQGLCPECLIKAGLGTGVDIGPETAGPSGRVPFTAPSPEEVARLFPQLEILDFIGQGGMGAVYKARQKELDRVVALKLLPPGIGQNPSFADRFTREARALARLNHPGIVTLYEFGRADGLFYFLMEFVDGVSLRDLLNAGRVSPREALAIVPQICDALQYAHDQNIIHRDIKPENILLDRRGRVKVADFGVAKLVGAGKEPPAAGTTDSLALTQAGKVVGTPQYMAPEQLSHPDTVDHRADIYALGMVFYQMLTGELPGKRIEPPSHKVQIDVRLDEVVLRALERNPQLRYQQVSEVKTRVETIASQEPPGQPPAAAADTGPGGSPDSEREPSLQTPAPVFKPRLSRTALLGSVWILCFFVALVLVAAYGAPLSGGHTLPGELLVAVGQMMLALAWSAVFGAAILGAVAIAQIRRSAGRLGGLRLAVFGVLFSPLVVMDAILVIAVRPLLADSAPWIGFARLALLLAIVALDLFILKAAWRAMSNWVARSAATAAVAPRPLSRAFLGLAFGTMALGILGTAALTHIQCSRIHDNIDLPFVDDPSTIGRWTSVDFVDVPEQFTPESRSWQGELPFKELVLLPEGKTPQPWQTWTKGVIIHQGDKTASSYEIKNLAGTNFMFMEWKSGDYSILRRKPRFYVLRWDGGIGDQPRR